MFQTFQHPDKPTPGFYWWSGTSSIKACLCKLEEKTDSLGSKCLIWTNLETKEKAELKQGWGGLWMKLEAPIPIDIGIRE